jgi:endonuclease I
MWHKEDPIDQNEIDRNKLIFSLQNNTNPFIDNPELVDQIADF